jgi:ribonuclease-3
LNRRYPVDERGERMHGLEDRLGYQFIDISHMQTALTHPSYGSDHSVPHYQRLEFLGDAVLQLAVSKKLFELYPSAGEGKLTQARASIVCEESLCAAAKSLNVGRCIRLSVGEERSSGRDKASILSDVMEALFGAIYIDGGLDAAFYAVYRVLNDQFPTALDEHSDYKSRLQIIIQREFGSDLTYKLIRTTGAPHKPLFTVRAIQGGSALGEGSGPSKQSAQQAAAKNALSYIQSMRRRDKNAP